MSEDSHDIKYKIFYFILTVISLVVNLGVIYYCIMILPMINFTFDKNKYFFSGVAIASLLIPFSRFLQWLYILFHEISHATVIIIFSGNILGFTAKVDSGEVKTDKENIFIRLAPYLIPILPYIILIIHFLTLIYFRSQEQIDLKNDNLYFSFFLISFFYTVVTYYNIKLLVRETSDIDTEKLMLSFSLILNFYAFSSASLLYLLYESGDIVEKFYLLD